MARARPAARAVAQATHAVPAARASPPVAQRAPLAGRTVAVDRTKVAVLAAGPVAHVAAIGRMTLVAPHVAPTGRVVAVASGVVRTSGRLEVRVVRRLVAVVRGPGSGAVRGRALTGRVPGMAAGMSDGVERRGETTRKRLSVRGGTTRSFRTGSPVPSWTDR